MDVLVASKLLLQTIGLLTCTLGCIIVAMLLVVRPWDSNPNRAYKLPLSTPYPVFWTAAWVYTMAEWIAAMKPAPMRIAELSNSYIQTQVLFSIVSLGIPDALLSGSCTAAELAAAIGPSTNAEWLDRLLSAAAVMGMLKRSKTSRAAVQQQAAAAPAGLAGLPTNSHSSWQDHSSHTDTLCAKDQFGPEPPATTAKATAAAAPSSGTTDDYVYVYSLNAFSAALTQQSPVNMSAAVEMMQDHYGPFGKLHEGIRTGTIPYELHTGGKGFWEHCAADPTRAARFDHAMVAVNHFGGSAVVHTYPWGHHDCVIDVAGGVGGFMVDVLRKVPGLKKGVVFDLASNIKRAKELWSRNHPHLLPKVQLVSGDMFDADTVPTPPPDSSSTAYVLRNILHDWPDADCIKILKAIRKSVDRAAAAAATNGSSSKQNVRLLVIEMTTAEDILPCHLPHRHTADLIMLESFGDAKERNMQQFAALLGASGWRLLSLTPTSGVFMVIEAEPL